MKPDLYVLSDCFYTIKARKMIPKHLLKEINGINSFLLIDSNNKDIYLISETVYYLLQEFRHPKSFGNIAETIENGILPNREINKTVEDFFTQLTHRKILVSISTQPEINTATEKPDIQGYDLLEVMRINGKTVTAVVKDKKEDKPIVLKYLMNNIDHIVPKEITYYQKEFEIMEKIGSHRLIRELLFFDKDKNQAALEFIKGRPLNELIKIGKLKMKHKLYLAHQIIESLSVIHEKNIAHGDIHAGQFLVALNLDVKLIDFGVSVVCLEKNKESGINIWIKDGAVHYFEPENISNNVFDYVENYIPDFYMDIYRMGILIYLLIYERFPFESISLKQLYNKVITGDPVFDSHIKGEEIPEFIINIIRKSTQKNPLLRYKSATEVFNYFESEYNS
jgi:serine/threonine protein kinase